MQIITKFTLSCIVFQFLTICDGGLGFTTLGLLVKVETLIANEAG